MSNTVNGKPVVYWKNRTGGTVPSNAGQVIFGNCSDISISNFTFSDVTVGVTLGHCENITITDVISYNQLYGIKTYLSHNNTFKSCTLVYNLEGGLWLYQSNRNDVYSNLFSNTEYGFSVSGIITQFITIIFPITQNLV